MMVEWRKGWDLEGERENIYYFVSFSKDLGFYFSVWKLEICKWYDEIFFFLESLFYMFSEENIWMG